jgi:membrane protease YdiL (CAAX protease family)
MTLPSIIVMVPVFEEILFRGFSYPPCARRFGVTGAAIITTAVWSLGHDRGAVDIIKIAIMSIMFARIYRRTQPLLPTIALHIALNCAAAVMAWADSFRNVVKAFPLVFLGALAIIIPSVIILFKVAPTDPDERRIFLRTRRAKA